MGKVEVKCPHCGALGRVEDEFLNATLSCPQCRKEFIIAKPEARAQATRFAEPKGAPVAGENLGRPANAANRALAALSADW